MIVYDKKSTDYKEAQKVWDEFTNEIKYNNRFFSGEKIIQYLNQIPQSGVAANGFSKMSDEGFCENGSALYRARLGNHKYKLKNGVKEEIDNKCMMAPPIDKSTSGRVNPQGISYLYLADSQDTAISEIKPLKGQEVTVATVIFKSEIKFFNISIAAEMKYESYEDIPKYKREAYCLSKIIADYMSEIIIENHSIEYIPYQFVAEYAKQRGYTGISYKSSVCAGYNYVLFNQENAKIVDKKVYIIENVEYKKKVIE